MKLKIGFMTLLALIVAAAAMAPSVAAFPTDVPTLAFPANAPAVSVGIQQSQPCAVVIGDYLRWAQKAGAMVDSQLVGLAVKTRDPEARLEHKFGRWAFARLDARGDTLRGVYQEYFSDRMKGSQRFYKDAYDWLEVTFSPEGGITVKLLSWGGGVTKLTNVYCSSDGYIIARWPGQWEQALMFVLVKTYE